METFSALLALCVRGIHRSSVNSPHKGQWRGSLMCSLTCAWIIGWVNNREAGDLRHHRVHYNVTVMGNGGHSHRSLVPLMHWQCTQNPLSTRIHTIYISIRHSHSSDTSQSSCVWKNTLLNCTAKLYCQIVRRTELPIRCSYTLLLRVPGFWTTFLFIL